MKRDKVMHRLVVDEENWDALADAEPALVRRLRRNKKGILIDGQTLQRLRALPGWTVGPKYQ